MTEELWARCRAGDTDARDQLVVHYSPLVREVARSMASNMPNYDKRYADHDDLVSLGAFGLLDAIKRFDPDRGNFETYARQRIRGAMRDGLRSVDWVPRNVRARARALDDARHVLRDTFGRGASDREMADHLGTSEDRLREIGMDAMAGRMLSIDREATATRPNGDTEHAQTPTPILDMLVVEDTLDDMRALRVKLAEAIAGLEPHHFLVISLYYREEWSLPQIATLFGVKVTRVSQLQTAAIRQIQAALAA
jgi:RNA polymerase sigma factor for flagellar operon FliA